MHAYMAFLPKKKETRAHCFFCSIGPVPACLHEHLSMVVPDPICLPVMSSMVPLPKDVSAQNL